MEHNIYIDPRAIVTQTYEPAVTNTVEVEREKERNTKIVKLMNLRLTGIAACGERKLASRSIASHPSKRGTRDVCSNYY